MLQCFLLPLVYISQDIVSGFIVWKKPGHLTGCLPAHFRGLSPSHMPISWAVACFTAHIYFRPGRLKLIGGYIISFFQICRMAFRTHTVPVLALPGPMEPVRMIIRMIRKGIPFFLNIIPGNGQALQSSPFKGNQILLQGRKTTRYG